MIDTKGIKYPAYPVKDGVKFQIRTKMNSKRPLIWHGNNYLYLFDNNPYMKRQWFTFDSRTHTIRSIANRRYTVYATHFNNNAYARMIVFSNKPTQFMQWHEGSRRNIRTNRKRCLDVQSGSDTHMRHIIFYNCHNGLNQGWWIDQSGAQFRKQPFSNGIKFQIRSRMAGNRALYHHYQHIGSHQYRALIRASLPGEDRQWWIFDSRTRSIRAHTRRNYAISNQYGQKFLMKKAVVIRPWKNEHYQKLSFYPGKLRNLRNPAGYCIDVYQNKNKNDARTIFYICHNGAN
jgi:hypothetical protein